MEIKLYKPVDKCREFAGVLEGVDKDSITILEGETARTFRRTDVAQVRLAIDF